MLSFSNPVSFNLPESYHELTLSQFIHLHKTTEQDIFSILEIITGVQRETWMNIRETDMEIKLLPHLEWMKHIPDFTKLEVPAVVSLAGREVIVPTRLNVLTWGQKLQFQDALTKAFDEQGNIKSEMIPAAIAVYLSDSNPYNDEKYNKTRTEVLQLPVTHAYPIASFFLSGFLKYYS